MDSENEQPKQICTECLYTGDPSISLGRVFVEFILNLLFVGGTPVFHSVRHCPACSNHSMVAISSEAGQNALVKLKSVEKETPKENHRQGQSLKHSDLEWTRIRSQR